MVIKIGNRGLSVKLMQNKLIKFGYKIKSDGVFGLNTLMALRAFQKKTGIKVDGIYGKNTKQKMYNFTDKSLEEKPKSEHFSYEEFIRKNDKSALNNGIPKKYWDNIQSLMDRLEIVRERIGGHQMIIRSGYRSKTHNKNVGGAALSQHLFGKAVDVYVKDYAISCFNLAKSIYDDETLRCLFGGFGLGSDKNLHLDIRTKADPKRLTKWWYGKKTWNEWSRGK